MRPAVVREDVDELRSWLNRLGRDVEWFNGATQRVLTGARVLLDATVPRQVEEATTTLLGAEMHRRLEAGGSLWFDRWFVHVTDSAATVVRANMLHDGGDWQSSYRLLHGLGAVGAAERARFAEAHLALLRAEVEQHSDMAEPDWLAEVSQLTATGQVWQLRDVTGGRRAVIAGLSYPGHADRCVYLFDIDVCGFNTLAGAGVYDNEEQAAATWRTLAGATAEDAALEPVFDSRELELLVHLDVGGEHLVGNESRSAMDNWFRARRRLDDLATALGRLNRPLPPHRSLYADVDIDPAVAAFTAWHQARHGVEPDVDATEALATEWLEGRVPGTEHVATAHRAAHVLALPSDWRPDAATLQARALLPEWVRWNGQQSGLPESLAEAAVAVAAGRPRAATDCPGAS